jgi:hypothetical protein
VIRRSSLALALFLVVLAVPLAGCRAQTGAAFFYGDERVSTTEVEDQVAEVLDDADVDKLQRGGDVRKDVVLVSIYVRIFQGIAKSEDIDVDQDLIKNGTKQLRESPRPTWRDELQSLPAGLAASFAVYRGTIFSEITQEAGQQGFDAALAKMVADELDAHPVTVNPRYGRFDPESVRLVEPKNPAVKDRETGPDVLTTP